MKKFSFLVLSVMLVSGAYSYEFKIMGGIASSKPGQIMQPAIPELRLNAVYKGGFLAGGGVELSLMKHISFEIDALYFQKRYKIEFYELGQFHGYSNGELNELSFPLLLKISILPGTTPYLLGGGEFAFVLAHKIYGQDITKETKKTDYGPVFGAGFETKVGRFSVFIEGRYHIGLQDLSREEDYYYLPFKKINSFIVMAGFLF